MKTYNFKFQNLEDKKDFIANHFPFSRRGAKVNNPYSSGLCLSISFKRDEDAAYLGKVWDAEINVAL